MSVCNSFPGSWNCFLRSLIAKRSFAWRCLDTRVLCVSLSGHTCFMRVSVWTHVFYACRCLDTRVLCVSLSGHTCFMRVAVWTHVFYAYRCLDTRVSCVSLSGHTCFMRVSVWTHVFYACRCLHTRVSCVALSARIYKHFFKRKCTTSLFIISAAAASDGVCPMW